MAKILKIPFRPRARLFQLLGDQLIGSPRLAVFELVKNGYDADASHVLVRLSLTTSDPTLVVQDDGEGMDLKTIRDVWLEPGADYREQQRKNQKRTPKFRRLPLGEKGVGRFAAHKLGQKITMVTRRASQPEYKVSIDWAQLMGSRYMDQAKVSVEENRTPVFTGNKTGTRITISKLRSQWTRAEIRHLHRNLTSISTPFARNKDAFEVRFELPEKEQWVVEVSPVCDHAQGKIGLNRYLLGLLVPYDRKGKLSSDNFREVGTINNALWATPSFEWDGSNWVLLTNAKFIVGIPKDALKSTKPLFRIREQLFMKLTVHVSNHEARPGVTEVRLS